MQKPDILPREIELGKRAECWFCDSRFTKAIYCATCGFYRCGKCRRCACDFPEYLSAYQVRRMLRKTIRAMAGMVKR